MGEYLLNTVNIWFKNEQLNVLYFFYTKGESMNTKLWIASALMLVLNSSVVLAQEKTAEELIKTMKKEDITYAQLMDGMAIAINNIQAGIIGMNKMLVKEGIHFIRNHPAPKKKPWVIMDKEDHVGFKATLVAFDKQMDEDVLAIETSVKKNNWNEALEGLNAFNNTCMSCHNSWKNKVKYVMK